jgi:periplasmic copper chaperone A
MSFLSIMSRRRIRAPGRAPIALAAAGGLVLVSAFPASAHVEVSSPDATPGGFGKLVFSVPTESATASTTRLQVTLPTRTPFASVSARPLPGWRVSTKQRKLPAPVSLEGFTLTKAVGVVTWTAAPGKGVRPGEFQEFELSVGPFAKGASSVAMPVAQTYSDGTVVRWNQPSVEGRAEPEHPTPTLRLTAAGTAGQPQPASAPTRTVAAPGSSAGSTDAVARWLGALGIVLGLVGVAVAVTTTRRRRG